MQPEMKSFLEEGLTEYAKAKNTVAAFEDEVQYLLNDAVKGRQNQRWSPLRNVKPGRPTVGGGSGGYGCWISVSITGKSQRYGDAEIDCGLWWDCPDSEISEPIIYAEFYKKPRRVVKFSWDRNKKGIRHFVQSGRTFLYLPIPKSLEIADPLNRLLDALLKQLR